MIFMCAKLFEQEPLLAPPPASSPAPPPNPTSHTSAPQPFFVILPTSVTQRSSLGWSETKGLLCSHGLRHAAAQSSVSGDNNTSPPSQGDCKAQIHHSPTIHPSSHSFNNFGVFHARRGTGCRELDPV